ETRIVGMCLCAGFESCLRGGEVARVGGIQRSLEGLARGGIRALQSGLAKGGERGEAEGTDPDERPRAMHCGKGHGCGSASSVQYWEAAHCSSNSARVMAP